MVELSKQSLLHAKGKLRCRPQLMQDSAISETAERGEGGLVELTLADFPVEGSADLAGRLLTTLNKHRVSVGRRAAHVHDADARGCWRRRSFATGHVVAFDTRSRLDGAEEGHRLAWQCEDACCLGFFERHNPKCGIHVEIAYRDLSQLRARRTEPPGAAKLERP